MRTHLLLALLLIVSFSLSGQEFLETNPNLIIDPEMSKGLPDGGETEAVNFETGRQFDYIDGLAGDKAYVVTNAQQSTITVEKENIGRLVVYARLFDAADSLLYNPNAKRNGRIMVRFFRGGKEMKDMASVTDFSEYVFQQIHLNTYRPGIDRAEIVFNTSNQFILDKLRVIPYTTAGVNHYAELERSEQDILDWSKNLTDEAQKIKNNYRDQIKRIETSHRALSGIITGQIFQNIARVQANSLNPFRSEAFQKHYNQILEKANNKEREQLKKVSNELATSDLTNVATTLDNLFLGGKFTTAIGLVSNMFGSGINNLLDSKQNRVDIITLQNEYYQKEDWKDDRFKLYKVTDEELNTQINQIVGQNQAYTRYVTDIVGFLKDDANLLKAMETDIALAKTLRTDMEDLTWEILKNHTDRDRSTYVTSEGISFSEIGVELERLFNTNNFSTVTELKQLRGESITNIKRIADLMEKYNKVVSRIKTRYDLLYEIRPKERKRHFDALLELPADIKVEWKNSQDAIIEEYVREGGLQQLLAKATGNES